MRARMQKRQLYRRVTIIAVVVAILLVLAVGFYSAYELSNSNAPADGKPVSSSNFSELKQLSLPPYGPPSASMVSAVKSYTGSPFTSNGKPVVVYIGAEFCMYCAAQRWSLVLSLLRFGNLSNLQYMSSSPAEGDYPTFTFQNATYSSKYFVFQPFEQENRNEQPLQTVPSNYSAVFAQYNSAYPFLDFGNRYIISGALWEPTALAGMNWTGVLNDIRSNTTLGTEIKAGANVITAVICELTGNSPGSVCAQYPINSITISLVSYHPASLGTASQEGALSASFAQLAAPSLGEQYEPPWSEVEGARATS